MDRAVVVADCDHPSLAIEEGVLADTCRSLPWHACRSEDAVIAECNAAEGLLIQYAPITRRVMQAIPNLRVIVRYGVGVDTVDLAAAAGLGVIVSNVPDYGTDEVSDHALALMMCLSRKVVQSNAQVKSGVWDFRLMHPVHRLRGRTLGIVGLGLIGSTFARKAAALGVRLIGFDPYAVRERLPEGLTLVDLETLLRESDIVSLHCPLNDETRNLLDARRLGLMKPSAFLINVARGGIVDEVALDRALADGRLAGAAMDVLAKEPGTIEHPLFRHDNFLCTPHMAWHSEESAQELKRKAAEEVRRVLRGEPPRYQVNKAGFKARPIA